MPMVSESTPLSGPPLARRLACAALEVDHAALPPEVLDKAKVCLIDFLSCALEARELPWSRQAIAVAPEQTHAGAPIVGTRKRTTIGDAASMPSSATDCCARTCTPAASRISAWSSGRPCSP
jgi:2-methylcitrate dehydratase PrpD